MAGKMLEQSLQRLETSQRKLDAAFATISASLKRLEELDLIQAQASAKLAEDFAEAGRRLSEAFQ